MRLGSVPNDTCQLAQPCGNPWIPKYAWNQIPPKNGGKVRMDMTSADPNDLLSSKPVEELTYEQALGELEAVVASLENDERPLEQALKLYERGQALARYCADLLDKAELKIRQISGEDLVDFDPQA
jgi:exodeoxyribonuclease VII small subunit